MISTGIEKQHPVDHPIEHSWINRAGSEDFSSLVNYRDDFQAGARRFDLGEKSNPRLLAGTGAVMDMILAWNVGSIAETLATKTEMIALAAREEGLSAAPIGVRAPHFLALGFPNQVPSGLLDKLTQRNVFNSLRGASLRVAPHLCNEAADGQQLFEALLQC